MLEKAVAGPLLTISGLIDGEYEGNDYFDQTQNIKVNSLKSQKIIRENISYLFPNFALIENESVEANLMMALKYVKRSKSEK